MSGRPSFPPPPPRARTAPTERVWRAATVALLAALLLYALSPYVRGRRPERTVVFYGFSILGDVMQKAVFPAFREEWKARTGEDVEFISAFAGSGTITNQIVMGVPAELGLLSLELDAERVAQAGVTPPGSWRALPFHGALNRTPFLIVVRPGNPLGIQGFADLARPGVRIVHPDPLTSGGALWAVMAEYGSAALDAPDRREAGYQRLLGVWRNVVAQASSARAARTQFENGFGDVLVTYEQDVLADVRSGRMAAEIVVPRSTIMSEHTLVVLDRNIRPADRPLIDALVAFLWSEKAQRLFVQYGFRSVIDRLNVENPTFSSIPRPFLIADFGGWDAAKRDVIDAIWRDRVLPRIQP
jgi:sulfate transport system substrate-binding protein